MTRRIVFTGPTLPGDAVLRVLPGAELHPPIRHGDLLRLEPAAGDVVTIIDGLFQQAEPIRHKEILWALGRGVSVVGAASMGALRAAELGRFGMRGIGRIHRVLALGIIDGDDEVAVAHAGSEEGWRPVSTALVNLRYTCLGLIRRELITRDDARCIVRSAARLSFDRRVLPEIMARAIDEGCGPERAVRLQGLLREHAVDVKRDDALEALGCVARHGPTVAGLPPGDRGGIPRSWWVPQWRAEAVTDRQHPPRSDGRALEAARLLLPDAAELHRRAGLLELGEIDARHRNAAPRCPISDLAELDEPALEEVAARLVVERGWFPVGRVPFEVAERWFTREERGSLGERRMLAWLAARALRRPSGQGPGRHVLATLSRRGQLDALRRVGEQVHASAVMEEPPGPEVARRFAAQWGVSMDDLLPTVLARGFPSPEEFIDLAPRYLPVLEARRASVPA